MAELRRRLEEQEERLRAAHAAAGRKYVGVERARRVSWRGAPLTRAPRRVCDPHIAARDTTVRGRALERLRRFRAAYRDALRRWCNGERDTLFPAGTYHMCVRFGVRCHGPPDANPFAATG